MTSANLAGCPREGLQRVGFGGVVDIALGPAAYDVAALCQDVANAMPMPADIEADLRRHYLALRAAANAQFDAEAFADAYATIPPCVRAARWAMPRDSSIKGGPTRKRVSPLFLCTCGGPWSVQFFPTWRSGMTVALGPHARTSSSMPAELALPRLAWRGSAR